MTASGADGRRWSPSWREYGRNYGHLAIYVALPGLIGILVSAWLSLGWIAVWPLLVIIVLAAGYLMLANGVERVTIIDGVLANRDSFGLQRRWPVSEVSAAVITTNLTVAAANVGAQPPRAAGRNLFVYGTDGQRLFRLMGAAWTLEQFEQIAAALPHAKLETITETTTPAELEKRHPGSIRLIERRPFWPSLLIALLLVAAVVVYCWFAYGSN